MSLSWTERFSVHPRLVALRRDRTRCWPRKSEHLSGVRAGRSQFVRLVNHNPAVRLFTIGPGMVVVAGSMLESFVAMELRRQADWGTRARIALSLPRQAATRGRRHPRAPQRRGHRDRGQGNRDPNSADFASLRYTTRHRSSTSSRLTVALIALRRTGDRDGEGSNPRLIPRGLTLRCAGDMTSVVPTDNSLAIISVGSKGMA